MTTGSVEIVVVHARNDACKQVVFNIMAVSEAV